MLEDILIDLIVKHGQSNIQLIHECLLKGKKDSEKNGEKDREYTCKITCTRAVIKYRILKEVSNECYGNRAEVWL